MLILLNVDVEACEVELLLAISIDTVARSGLCFVIAMCLILNSREYTVGTSSTILINVP